MLDIALSFLLAQSVGPGFIGRPIHASYYVCLNDTRPSSYVNVRVSPSQRSRSIGRLNHGASIYFIQRVVGNDNFYWTEVDTPHGVGWIRDDYTCIR